MNLYFLAIFGLVFTTFIWGITFELVEESLKSIPPNIFNAIRFFIASLCALILIIIRNGKVSFSNFEIKTGLICAMLLSLGYFFQSLGLWENSFFLKSDPNKSAFITGTSVLMVPIIMYIMNKGKISSHLWVSIFFVLLGMAVLLNPKVEKFTFGDILTFFCALSLELEYLQSSLLSPTHTACHSQKPPGTASQKRKSVHRDYQNPVRTLSEPVRTLSEPVRALSGPSRVPKLGAVGIDGATYPP